MGKKPAETTDNGSKETGQYTADFGPVHFLINIARDLFLVLLSICPIFVIIELAKNTSVSFYLNLEILIIILTATGMITFLFFSDREIALPLMSKVTTRAAERTLGALTGIFTVGVVVIGTMKTGSGAFTLVLLSGFAAIFALVFLKKS